MKITKRLEEWQSELFFDCEQGRSVYIDNETYTCVNDYDVFKDSQGSFWKFTYTFNSYDDYPRNGELFGPVEPKVKEVIVYE